MSVKIAICDDTPQDISLLSAALYTYDPYCEIYTYTDGETLIDELPELGPFFDILFLDIYMPGLDGIITAQKIRSENKDIKIIFISSSKEYYPQAYEVFAFNYIVKPFDREKLFEVLDRAIAELGRECSHKILFRNKSSAFSVYCRDILYIESRDKLLLFQLADGSLRQRYGKLVDITTQLPPQTFIRCHQSFLVNAAHITEMGENYFRVGQVLISISRKYIKESKDQYYSYLFSHMGGGLIQ